MKTRNSTPTENSEKNAQQLANVILELIENASPWAIATVPPVGQILLEFASSVKFLLNRMFDYLLSSDKAGQNFNLEGFFFQSMFVEDSHWMDIWRKRSKNILRISISSNS
jgi:hypothetical protein